MITHSFSTLGCPELTLDAVAALAARHGFHTVELRALRGRLDLPNLLEEDFKTPEAWAQYLKARRIKISALSTSFTLIGSDEKSRAELIECVRWADAAEVPWLRIIDGGGEGSPDELREAAETLRWWREQRLKNFWAVDCLVEPHDALKTTPALREFLTHAPDATLLWDSHRTWKHGKEDPLQTWETVRNHTVYIHVKDSVNIPNDRLPYTYVIPGDGEFPMADLLNTLKSERFHGILSLEWNRFWHPELPELDQALHSANRRGWW